MAELSNYAENKLLNHILRAESFTMPSGLYLALFTSNPAEDNSGNEVTGGSYARQAIAFSIATTGSTTNSGLIEFTGLPTAIVTHIALLDAVTSGNLLMYTPLSGSISLGSGDGITVAIGAITASLN